MQTKLKLVYPNKPPNVLWYRIRTTLPVLFSLNRSDNSDCGSIWPNNRRTHLNAQNKLDEGTGGLANDCEFLRRGR